MGNVTVYKDGNGESTIISNIFIDQYMKDANDAQLKVYLFLLRTFGANLSTSVSEMADLFNHTEKDILRALKYWEKQNLLSLDYDNNNCLHGIHLLDPQEQDKNTDSTVKARPSTDVVTLAPVVNMPLVNSTSEAPQQNKPIFKKPVYSADQLSAFANNENAQQLVFVAEALLQRPITSSEMCSLYFFMDQLHFSIDLIDFLLDYCIEHNKKSFKYMEAVAINWAENNITTRKQAAKFASKYDKQVYTIMNDLGRNQYPTEVEFSYINRWMKEYGFAADVIKEACRRTSLATDSHRFEYADKILTSWFQSGVRHLSDIQTADANFQKKKTQTTVKSNKFNQYTQNTYDYAALEKDILSN